MILYCNVSLLSESAVQFKWRHNGQDIGDNDSRKQISISDYEYASKTSELHIRNVSLYDEGGYECLVLDGGTAFITISDTAHIKVLGM